jgi:hypothetical protein
VNAGAFINGGLATMASKLGFFAGFGSRIMSHSLSRVSPCKISNSLSFTPCSNMFMRARL